MPPRKRAPVRRRRAVKYSRTKKMVTGHGPTLLEKIASGVGSAAKLATAVAPIVAAINTEHKYYDQTATITSYGTATAPQLGSLTSAVPIGTSDQNRIGNSVLLQDIQLRLAMSMPMTTTSATPVLGCFHRVMILVWKDNASQNVPSVTKILQSPSNIYSPVNKDYSDQFVVVKDKFVTFNPMVVPGTSTSGTQGFRHMKFFKKCNWHLRWDAAGNPTQNHIYMLTMSTPSGSSNAVGTTYYSRINYTDN